jgi:hypothetical protein
MYKLRINNEMEYQMEHQMKKTTLIAYMEAQKTKTHTDEFVSAIFESRPDIMQLDAATRGDPSAMYDISDRKRNVKKNEEMQRSNSDEEVEEDEIGDIESDNGDGIRNDEDTEIEESESIENDEPEDGSEEEEKKPTSQLDIIDNSGYKQVAFNEAFNNMTEKMYPQISDIFTEEAVGLIQEGIDSDWIPVERRLLMCNEEDYKSSKEKMRCYNSSNPRGMGKTNIFKRQYLDKYYKATYSGKLEAARGKFIIFERKDINESIEIMDISPKLNGVTFAINSKLSSEADDYLMKGSKLHVDFIFRESIIETDEEFDPANTRDVSKNFNSESLEAEERETQSND